MPASYQGSNSWDVETAGIEGQISDLLTSKVLLEDHWPVMTIHSTPILFLLYNAEKEQHDSRNTRTTSDELGWTKTN